MLFNPKKFYHHNKQQPHDPAEATRPKPAQHWHLSKHQHNDLVSSTVTLMNKAEPTAFAVEGDRRYELRSGLCSKGWPWSYADQQAEAIVETALNRVGAKRPAWIEGQPEYSEYGYLRDDRCWQCDEPLAKYRHRFCSERCARIAGKLKPHNMFELFY